MRAIGFVQAFQKEKRRQADLTATQALGQALQGPVAVPGAGVAGAGISVPRGDRLTQLQQRRQRLEFVRDQLVALPPSQERQQQLTTLNQMIDDTTARIEDVRDAPQREARILSPAVRNELFEKIQRGEQLTQADVDAAVQRVDERERRDRAAISAAVQGSVEQARRANLRLTPVQQRAVSGLNLNLGLAEALSDFSPAEISRWVGFLRGNIARVGQLARQDPDFARFQALTGRLRAALLFSREEGGGGALTPAEQSALESFIPTGRELTVVQFKQKLQQLEQQLRARVNESLALAGLPQNEIQRINKVFDTTRQTIRRRPGQRTTTTTRPSRSTRPSTSPSTSTGPGLSGGTSAATQRKKFLKKHNITPIPNLGP